MRFKSEKGQAMVEFALLIIPLFIIISGIINFGWIFHHRVIVNNACREGARYAAVHSNDSGYNVSDTRTIVGGLLPNTLDGKDDNANGFFDGVKVTPGSSPYTGNATVTITGEIKILMPFMSLILDPDGNGTYTVSSQSIMKIEN